jgi:hypothetical protein
LRRVRRFCKRHGSTTRGSARAQRRLALTSARKRDRSFSTGGSNHSAPA